MNNRNQTIRLNKIYLKTGDLELVKGGQDIVELLAKQDEAAAVADTADVALMTLILEETTAHGNENQYQRRQRSSCAVG